jgi:multiple sugar transport system substrate-binding protein
MRNLTRRDFLRFSAAGAAGAVLAACAPAAPQIVEVEKPVVVKEEVVKEVPVEKVVEKVVTPTARPAQERVTVKYWGHNFEPRVKLDKVYIEQFMDENPHITVQYDQPGDYNTMLPTALAAGTAGDVFGHSDGYLGHYYLQDAIVPVDYTAFGMDEATFMDAYIEPQNTLQGATKEGELYGIPNELSIYALYVNNTLFEEAGLDPDADHPKTWEEYVEVAEMLTKREAGKLVQRGGQLGWGAANWWYGGQLRQIGGREVSEDLRTAVIDSPEGLRVLQWWKDWVDQELGGPQYPQGQSECLLGTIAMWNHTGSWRRAGLLEAEIDYSVYPFPRWSDATRDMGAMTYAYFHMVNAQSPDSVKRAAWQLAWYLDSYPARYLDFTGLLQPQKKILDSEAYQNTPFLDVFLDEMSKGEFQPAPPSYFEIRDMLGRMRERVAEGTDAKESLEIANEEIQVALDEGWAALS